LPVGLLGPFEAFYPWFSGGAHILDVGTELQLHPGYDVPTLIIQAGLPEMMGIRSPQK
jgi:hypothetical protein